MFGKNQDLQHTLLLLLTMLVPRRRCTRLYRVSLQDPAEGWMAYAVRCKCTFFLCVTSVRAPLPSPLNGSHVRRIDLIGMYCSGRPSPFRR